MWEAEERQALLLQTKADMAAELQSMKDQAQAQTTKHHGDADRRAPEPVPPEDDCDASAL